MSSGARLSVQFPVDDVLLSELHRLAFGTWDVTVKPWASRLARHSLTWVGAFDDAGTLIGFVNLAWDGGAHAFVLDTVVHPGRQGRGIGRDLVLASAAEARRAGCTWLHVDYEPHLGNFYRDACGFRRTEAGLIDLTP